MPIGSFAGRLPARSALLLATALTACAPARAADLDITTSQSGDIMFSTLLPNGGTVSIAAGVTLGAVLGTAGGGNGPREYFVTNAGSLNGSATASYGYQGTGSFTNLQGGFVTGSINSQGLRNAINLASFGVDTNDITLSNAGTIDGVIYSGTHFDVTLLPIDRPRSQTFINTGTIRGDHLTLTGGQTITATNSGSMTASFNAGSATTQTITFTNNAGGTITNSNQLNAQAVSLVTAPGGTVNVTNNGSITTAANATGIYLFAINGATNGSFTNAGSITATGAVNAISSPVPLVNTASGTITARLVNVLSAVNNGALIFPSGFVTSTIAGNYTHGANAVLTMNVNQAGTGDRLSALGQAILQGGTLNIVAEDGPWATSRSFQLITTGGGVSGTFSNVNVNRSYLTMTTTYNPLNVTVVVANASASPSPSPTPSPTPTPTPSPAPTPSPVPSLSGAILGNNQIGAQGRTETIVVENLLGDGLLTNQEIAERQASSSTTTAAGIRFRSYLADAFVEANKLSGAKSTISGMTLGSTVEFDNNLSVGALVPIDYMSLPGADAMRYGVVLYGQYDYRPADEWSIKPTAYANYIYTDSTSGAGRNIGTYGGGGGVAVTYDNGTFVPSGVAALIHNKDNTNLPNDYVTTLALGGRMGYRPSDVTTVQLSATWNRNLASYMTAGMDADYWDAGVDVTYRIGQSFRLNVSYQTVLGIDRFTSNRFLVGGRFAF